MFSRSLLKPQWLSHGTRLPISLRIRRSYAIRPEAPSFPTIPACPSPSCCPDWAETPQLPENLPIDHATKLNGTMAPYAEQVLICTGKDDWPSKIQDENNGENLATEFQRLLTRGGEYADVITIPSIASLDFSS